VSRDGVSTEVFSLDLNNSPRIGFTLVKSQKHIKQNNQKHMTHQKQGCQVRQGLHGYFTLNPRPFCDLSRPQNLPPRPFLRPLFIVPITVHLTNVFHTLSCQKISLTSNIFILYFIAQNEIYKIIILYIFKTILFSIFFLQDKDLHSQYRSGSRSPSNADMDMKSCFFEISTLD
jgi:hypothetical protein